jgi:hypothetical protein
MVATQLPLFEQTRARTRRSRQRQVAVTHVPEIAESVGRRANLGCDLRSAFASFWASLPPERRAELKARLAA